MGKVRPTRPSKSDNQKIHAKNRLLERFPTIPPSSLKEMVRRIKSGSGSTFIRRCSNRVSIHELVVKGEVVHCVYDRKRGNIVTFLYKNNEVNNEQ